MTPDFIPSDPTVLALEDDIADVFAIHEVRVQGGGKAVVFIGQFLRSPAMVYEAVAERFAARDRVPVLRRESGRDILVAQLAPAARKARRVRTNVVLFVLTVCSTLFAGTLQSLPESAYSAYEASLQSLAVPPGAAMAARLACAWMATGRFLGMIAANAGHGVPFTLALLGILGIHELGHYFTARYYKLNVSLPYFIPFPNPLTGTLGAVIRIESPFASRKALFDVGIAGPLAGLAVAIPVLIVGLSKASLMPVIGPDMGGTVFNEPLLFKFLAWLVVGPRPAGMDLSMNPLLMAGWWGLLVTALNLLPVSQLDGGHIAYAIFGKAQRYVAWTMYGVAVLVALTTSPGYIVMLVLVFLMGLNHPPALDDITDIGTPRRVLGLATLLLFFALATPNPIQSIGGGGGAAAGGANGAAQGSVCRVGE
ncbi:MAG: site-2 protease family protein [Ardenticatenales bacterium]